MTETLRDRLAVAVQRQSRRCGGIAGDPATAGLAERLCEVEAELQGAMLAAGVAPSVALRSVLANLPGTAADFALEIDNAAASAAAWRRVARRALFSRFEAP